MRHRNTGITVVLAVLLSWSSGGEAQMMRERCSGDFDGDGRVTVDEVLISVNEALQGCAPPTAAASPTLGAIPTPTATAPCHGASIALAIGVTAVCVPGASDREDDCAVIRIEGDCPIGRACAAASASCSCVGGPLAGESSACQFSTTPGGIRCGGTCTGNCVISIEAD